MVTGTEASGRSDGTCSRGKETNGGYIKKIGAAVVGTGTIGSVHARIYNESVFTELVAVYDKDAKAGRRVASDNGTKFVENLEAILEDRSIQAVSVALPEIYHVEVACQLLLAGKDVLLEKPMADTLGGVRKIASAAARGGGRLMVGHTLRWEPRYAQVAKAVLSGELGETMHVHASRLGLRWWSERVGRSSTVCLTLGIHDIDAMQWITGKRIARVFSSSIHKTDISRETGSADAIFTTCIFEDGTLGSIHSSWALPNNMPSDTNFRLEVAGTAGFIGMDLHTHGLTVVQPSAIKMPDSILPIVNGRLRGPLADEIEHFARCLVEEHDFAIRIEDAMSAVAVSDAIHKSVESGKAETVELLQ
jgi:predicted dehydrogenase